MTIADEGMAARAGALIARWGAPGYLLRGNALRDCTTAVLDHKPRARGQELEVGDRVLLAAPLDVPPDHERDKLIMGKEGDWRLYQIMEPVTGPRPGQIVIYFEVYAVEERTVELGDFA